MTSSNYMAGRKQYKRPQALLFAENPGTLSNGAYIPDGYEVGQSNKTSDDFIILSDHNRSPISLRINRIEKRERMVNGRMRSFHVTDKLSISTSWTMLPSRSFASNPAFNDSTGKSSIEQYTVDGGAGGVELLDWYQSHTGPFWVYISYDNYSNFNGSNKYDHLNQYSEIKEMYISDFNYSVEKRGGTNYDMWNISISLEEA